MDYGKLREYTIQLSTLLDHQALQDAETVGLREALVPVFRQVLSGTLEEPMEWGDIPGVHVFDQGGLRQYPELEEAFSAFAMELADEADEDILAFVESLNDEGDREA